MNWPLTHVAVFHHAPKYHLKFLKYPHDSRLFIPVIILALNANAGVLDEQRLDSRVSSVILQVLYCLFDWMQPAWGTLQLTVGFVFAFTHILMSTINFPSVHLSICLAVVRFDPSTKIACRTLPADTPFNSVLVSYWLLAAQSNISQSQTAPWACFMFERATLQFTCRAPCDSE